MGRQLHVTFVEKEKKTYFILYFGVRPVVNNEQKYSTNIEKEKDIVGKYLFDNKDIETVKEPIDSFRRFRQKER